MVAYSETGDVQLAIRGYGDATAPVAGMQSAAPVPKRNHFFFVNAGMHRLYYFALSYGLLNTLIQEMPALYRLGNEPDYRNGDHWQVYEVTKEEFDTLRSIHATDLRGIKKHQFLQQQFYRLMERYHDRIDRYGNNPDTALYSDSKMKTDMFWNYLPIKANGLLTKASQSLMKKRQGLTKACFYRTRQVNYSADV